MIKTRKFIHEYRFLLLFYLCLSLAIVTFVTADTIITEETIYINFQNGEQFCIQSLDPAYVLTFTVESGLCWGTVTLTVTDTEGTLIIEPLTSASLSIASNTISVNLLVNNVPYSGPVSLASADTTTITWNSEAVIYPETLNVKPYWQYMLAGDALGFLQAIYVQAFNGGIDLLYGAVAMLFLVPLYIKTRNLVLLSILWILLGSFYIAAMASISGMAVIFMVLGVGSLLWRLVHPNN